MSRGAAKNFLKRKKETLTTTTTTTNKKNFNVQRHFSCSVVFETFGKDILSADNEYLFFT